MNSESENQTMRGVNLDECTEVTMDDLCQTCRVDQTVVISLIDEGIAEPNSREESPWRFSGSALPLIARAIRLQRDLDLNAAGVAFALDLLDEIEQLKKEIVLFKDNFSDERRGHHDDS